MHLAKLKEPFAAEDIEWRIQQAGETNNRIWARVLAYVTNRAIQDRLDDAVGPENWWNEYRPGPEGGVICGISILLVGRAVTKWDGAENTEIESVKGGLSNAMKRAAVQWGIGRYLYHIEENFAEVSTTKEKGWHYASAKIGEKKVSFWWRPPLLPSWALPPANRAVDAPAHNGHTADDRRPTSKVVMPSKEYTEALRNYLSELFDSNQEFQKAWPGGTKELVLFANRGQWALPNWNDVMECRDRKTLEQIKGEILNETARRCAEPASVA